MTYRKLLRGLKLLFGEFVVRAPLNIYPVGVCLCLARSSLFENHECSECLLQASVVEDNKRAVAT